MTSGSVTINGIDDRGLVIILEVKERHEGKLGFNPQQLQPSNNPGNPPKQTYNNVILSWSQRPGLEAVMEVLHRLAPEVPCHHHKKEE